MEGELTESLEIYSKTDNLAVTEEANVDESIQIYLLKELKTQAYKKTIKLMTEIFTHLKREKNQIQLNGRQSTK